MMHARPILLSSLATAAVLAYVCGACSSSSSLRQCNVGADCASGACNADGTCVAPSSTDGGKDGAAEEGGASVTDGGGTAKDGSYDFDAALAARQTRTASSRTTRCRSALASRPRSTSA